ncbi:MAG: hypothetical protein ABSF99_08330 [Anaerolineales bacterium]|jgi:hypothetical protein
MKLRLLCILVAVTMILGLAPTSVLAAPAAAGNGGLQPGQMVTYEQKIPVNIVFIGYDKKTVNQKVLLGKLPATYIPVVRDPLFYGVTGRDMGLKYDFKYNVSFTDSKFNNNFFKYLKSIGTPGDLTLFQQQYNAQANRVLNVTGPVLYIDAPSVENWLSKNLGVNQNSSYTIVFINWYGRPDFKFHVYTKTDEPDPDTGYNFGAARASRKMIAWGGGHSRTWFYDLSAGPEAWTNNWNITDADVDGDGVPDFRLPPIWEYKIGAYRDPTKLSGDLGLITRFVGIDLLFTTSPLYDPMVTAPGLGGKKVVNISMLEDDRPNSLGTDWINMSFVRKQLAMFEPYYQWQIALADKNPIDANAQNAFRIWADVKTADDCWNSYGTTFAELYCYFDANRSKYIPAYPAANYVDGIFAFNTTADNMGDETGLLGYTDDNWVDGTQSYVFAFDTDYYRSLGYGFSTTAVHESGHYFGMSHPHDGYDSEMAMDFGSVGDYYFTWSGDESNTIMSYIDLSDEFGQFDQDNMYRWEMAGYLNWSNSLLADILANPGANKVKISIADAQLDAQRAIDGFNKWNYLPAASNAREAYEDLSEAAAKLGIAIPSMQALKVAPNQIPTHEGDPIRFPDN